MNHAVGFLAVIFLMGAGCSNRISSGSQTTGAQKQNPPETQPDVVKPVARPTANPSQTQAAVTPKPPAVAETLVDCGSDFNCFSVRANACKKTKFMDVAVEETEEVKGLTVTRSIPYEITGLTSGKCQFKQGMMMTQMSATEEAIQNVMQIEGKTRDAVIKEIDDQNAQFKLAFKGNGRLMNEDGSWSLSLYNKCTTADGKNIADLVQKFRDKTVSLVQKDNMLQYGTTITCIEQDDNPSVNNPNLKR